MSESLICGYKNTKETAGNLIFFYFRYLIQLGFADLFPKVHVKYLSE